MQIVTSGLTHWSTRGPLLVRNFINYIRCREYLELYRLGMPRPRSYQGIVDENTRRCDFVELDQFTEDFVRLITEHAEDFFGTPISRTLSHTPVMYCYPPGVGFVAHHDGVTPIEIERAQYNRQPVIGGDLTLILFLNDPSEYAGGDLYFPEIGVSFKPTAGAAIIFPATEAFIHGVQGVSRGNRYTALCRAWVVS